MSHHVPHLKAFAEDAISSMGKDAGRMYLRRCIPHWSAHYGKDVAEHMRAHCRQLLRKAKG